MYSNRGFFFRLLNNLREFRDWYFRGRWKCGIEKCRSR